MTSHKLSTKNTASFEISVSTTFLQATYLTVISKYIYEEVQKNVSLFVQNFTNFALYCILQIRFLEKCLESSYLRTSLEFGVIAWQFQFNLVMYETYSECIIKYRVYKQGICMAAYFLYKIELSNFLARIFSIFYFRKKKLVASKIINLRSSVTNCDAFRREIT